LDLLKGELKQVPTSAAALAFLGMIIKDYGAVRESSLLYKDASTLRPDYPGYCLNTIHVLEVVNRYQQAFNEVQLFCLNNQKVAVGSLTCAHIYNALCHIDNIYDYISYDPQKLHKVDESKMLPIVQTPHIPASIPYDSDTLDILAIFCTVVKIVFVVGALELISPLVNLITPVREGRELHKTSIRNEHAYYCCIAQLMAFHTLPLKKYPFLYVAGDSHSMTLAWQTIQFKGETHLIKPLLVTGLKAWHLRPESKFFPKTNFYEVVPTAPRGSSIIFLFGEIDCREGLVISVRKSRYKDLEEGAAATVNIYINALKQLQEQYEYKIYIHPVVPVIDVTRHIVKIYNKILKERVMNTEGFLWLDFFDHLLTPDGEKLNSDFELDGTHMNPRYIKMLEEALNKVAK